MIEYLLHIRGTLLGKCLFVGYTLATFVTLLLVAFALLRLHNQGRQLKAQGVAQCHAISGAAAYWRGARVIINDSMLPSQGLPPDVKRGLGQLSLLLDGVISAADDLPCGKEAP